MNAVTNTVTVEEVNNKIAKEILSRLAVDESADFSPAITKHIISFNDDEDPIEKMLLKKFWNYYKKTSYKHIMRYEELRSDFKKFLKENFNITKENFSEILY